MSNCRLRKYSSRKPTAGRMWGHAAKCNHGNFLFDMGGIIDQNHLVGYRRGYGVLCIGEI